MGSMGKENDKDFGTAGLTQDYGFRLYNPAIAKFLSVDPLSDDYPWNSPYSFAENDVIRCIDLDGLEKTQYTLPGCKPSLDTYFGGRKRDIANATQKNNSGVNKQFLSLATDAIPVVSTAKAVIEVVTAKDAKSAAEAAIGIIPFTKILKRLGSFFKNIFKRKSKTVIDLDDVVMYHEEYIPDEKIKVDLMGGAFGTPTYTNYDLNAVVGIKDDVNNFDKHFKSNSVSEIMVNNPQAEFLDKVTPSLEEGGTMVIRGQFSNKFFAKIWDAKEIPGYDITKRTRDISSEGYSKTNGDPIKGNMNEIILQKQK